MSQQNSPSIFCNNVWGKIKHKINNFGDNSCLHGVRFVFSIKKIPLIKRLFWSCILILCGLSAVTVLRSVLQLFKGAVSFSVETTYLDWETPFPAVTVCEATMERKRILKFLNDNDLPTTLLEFYQHVAYWDSGFCKKCDKCELNQTCLKDIDFTVKSIRLACTDIFLPDCWWGHEKFICCDRFLPVKTEYGTCFAFNSRLTVDEANIEKLSLRTGLKKLDFSAAETIIMSVNSISDVFMTNSEDIHNIPPDTQFEIIVKAEQTISDTSVLSIPASLRGCLMSWERPEFANHWLLPFYTYDACIWYCRAIVQYQLCNCTHHFEPPMAGISYCDIKGLACLAVAKKKVLDLSSANCVCPMACDEVEYKIVHTFNTRGAKLGLPSRNVIGLADFPTLRVRRHAIRDRLSFVVDIGGMGGVFFGASVLSVIEIVYLLCLRRGR